MAVTHTVFICERAVTQLRDEWLREYHNFPDFPTFMRAIYDVEYYYDWTKGLGGTVPERFWITCADEQKAVQYKLMWS